MTPQPSRLTLEDTGGDRTFRVLGVIDSHTSGHLLEQLRGVGVDADISLDLAGVEFVDSSGLRAIVTMHQALDAVGCRLHLVDTSEAVERLLDITGLRPHLHMR